MGRRSAVAQKADIQEKTAYKEVRFVQEYMRNGQNGQQAAIAIGIPPAGAAVAASHFLKKPNVSQRLASARAEMQAYTEITVAKVVVELAKCGFANMQHYRRTTPDGEQILDLTELTPDQWAAVSELTTEKYTTSNGRGKPPTVVIKNKIKLHGKVDALEKIAKHLGAFDGHRGGGDDEPTVISYTLKIGNAVVNVNAQGEERPVRTTLVIPKAGNGVL